MWKIAGNHKSDITILEITSLQRRKYLSLISSQPNILIQYYYCSIFLMGKWGLKTSTRVVKVTKPINAGARTSVNVFNYWQVEKLTQNVECFMKMHNSLHHFEVLPLEICSLVTEWVMGISLLQGYTVRCGPLSSLVITLLDRMCQHPFQDNNSSGIRTSRSQIQCF